MYMYYYYKLNNMIEQKIIYRSQVTNTCSYIFRPSGKKKKNKPLQTTLLNYYGIIIIRYFFIR